MAYQFYLAILGILYMAGQVLLAALVAALCIGMAGLLRKIFRPR